MVAMPPSSVSGVPVRSCDPSLGAICILQDADYKFVECDGERIIIRRLADDCLFSKSAASDDVFPWFRRAVVINFNLTYSVYLQRPDISVVQVEMLQYNIRVFVYNETLGKRTVLRFEICINVACRRRP